MLEMGWKIVVVILNHQRMVALIRRLSRPSGSGAASSAKWLEMLKLG
jgi:hypothetical protein